VNEATEFLETFGTADFAHAEELLPLIRERAFVRILRSDTSLPCRHYADIYRERAHLLDAYRHEGDSDLYREFIALVAELSQTPEAPCSLWSFRGRSSCFTAFEASEPQRIAGCFKRPGMSDIEFNATGNA
jgi:hypothetical protein